MAGRIGGAEAPNHRWRESTMSVEERIITDPPTERPDPASEGIGPPRIYQDRYNEDAMSLRETMFKNKVGTGLCQIYEPGSLTNEGS
jgi:hypothetical protein